MSRIFDHPDGPDKVWDYVINLGGETTTNQTPEIYRLRNTQLSVTLAKEAARRGVKAFVEASTGMVYASSRTPKVESDKLKPWSKLAKSKLDAEEELSRIPGLNLVILRLPYVYGEYDRGPTGTILCLARVYQERGKELKWLWNGDLKLHGLQVEDAARAIWMAAEWRSKNSTIPELESSKRPIGILKDGPVAGTPVFNVVDHGDTTTGRLAKNISEVFNIKTGFMGNLISQFARLSLDHVVDDLNEDSLQPWADLLEAKGLTPGPLSPFVEKDLLKDNEMSLDGSLFERVTGFECQCAHEGYTTDQMKKMIASYQRMKWYP